MEEVITSEAAEGKQCRFAYLHQAILGKYILECGTNPQEFKDISKRSLISLKSIREDKKAGRFIEKQLSFWKRLSE